MTTFAGSYFPASYFPPGWSSGTVETDPGALRASVSGSALAAGSITARGYLFGAIAASASVQAFITQATGEIVAALAGGASVAGTLVNGNAVSDQPGGGVFRRASWDRFRGYDDRARDADYPPEEYQEPEPVWTLEQALAWLNSASPAKSPVQIDPVLPVKVVSPANATTTELPQPDIAAPPELEALTEADFDAEADIGTGETPPIDEPEDDTLLRLALLLTI